MAKTHASQRAEERYFIAGFNEGIAIKEIMRDNCLHLSSDIDKYSHTFFIRYNNKYVKVVTDYNVNHVKTLLPLKDREFYLVNDLIDKLYSKEQCVA